MYFTRSGKIKISTSDPICAVQITAIEQILNIPVKANIIWEGFTSRFLLFDIPTNVPLADVATELKNSNDIETVEIPRQYVTIVTVSRTHHVFVPVMLDALIVVDPILNNVQILHIAQTVKETIRQTPPIVPLL
ncbi:hypothetical protein TNCV_4784751 [Trichonephila clavipes]|nr:hypothetical protein TNCV_4784751 [Trichonephila clavipes]